VIFFVSHWPLVLTLSRIVPERFLEGEVQFKISKSNRFGLNETRGWKMGRNSWRNAKATIVWEKKEKPTKLWEGKILLGERVIPDNGGIKVS
jgi:hypothetical protein